MSKVQINLPARTQSPSTTGIPFYDGIAQTINEYGWRLMLVLPDPDESSDSFVPFIYTIGNYECGLPELLMIGCPHACSTSNRIVARMRQYNRAFMDGESIDLGKKCQPKAFWANEEAQEYTVQVGEYYGTSDYAVQQIVIPDTLGRYPGDPQCDLPYRLVPLLRNNGKH
jgi:Domain of unknown function (DUF4262)